MAEGKSLSSFKKTYGQFAKQYTLPAFNLMNADFGIEKASETETDFVLREVRRFIADKYGNYMRFVEALLNPVNAPMFVYSMVKAIGKEDKKQLEEAYKVFVRVEVALIELDVQYDEAKEARFIAESYAQWQAIKNTILAVLEKVKQEWDAQSQTSAIAKGYFG